MKKKILLSAIVICCAFVSGFLICYYEYSYCLHTKSFVHPNGNLARTATYKSKAYGIMPAEYKNGNETFFDENGKISEQGEWKMGRPWNGSCWIPAAGDAGSWGGLGTFKKFNNGVQID